MLRSLIGQLNSLIVALLLAGVVWSVATSEANPSRESLYPDALPIEIVNIPDGMVVTQKSATTVRLTIRAPLASWNQLSSGSIHVLADLQGLDAGLHQVPLKLQTADPQIVVTSMEPSSVGARLEPIKSRAVPIHSDILDSAPPGYTAQPPTVKPTQVTVTGPALLVDQVSEVVADVFLRGTKTPFDREVTLIARDAQGNTIQGVVLSPATATVSVQIEQRVGYKDVSVRATLKGAPAPGYWVSNIVVEPSTATIVGSADALGKIPGFVETMAIDVSGATSDVIKRVGLSLPEGASALNSEGVAVQVSVTPILGGQTVKRKVNVQGLRRGLIASVSPTQVDVILSGPVPTLEKLSPDDVQVVVDASGVGAGTFQMRPRAPIVPDSLKLQSIVPDSVQITITEIAPTPTIVPTATKVSTPTQAVPSILITPTLPAATPSPSR